MPTLNSIVACARAAHEANRAYCQALGDDSQASWDESPDWMRDSVTDGVKGVLEGNSPAQSHQRWLDFKLADGWTWGPVKDPEKKQHPCFVPYSELPEEQKRKDEIFVSVARAMAKALGLMT